MKKQLLCGLLAASMAMSASASLVFSSGNVSGSGTSLNAVIPDSNPNGITVAINVSGAASTLTVVTVTVNIAGGYNGDLYAYLAYNGTLVTLLNRVGTESGGTIQQLFGYSTAGFNNVTLGASGSDIHGVQNPTSGITYTPDGGSLSAFNGMNPNGTWTLFFADMSGGNVSTLNGWSLDITAVPEPVEVALAIFGVVLAAVAMVRRHRKQAPALRTS